MGGGRGSRLYPLTRLRCKPAVPLAGKYRLVDIPISNCINSGFTRIYLLTQFNTASLHRHIQQAFHFDPFGGGFVEILSAEQTEMNDNWYQGTADAVRQNWHHFKAEDDDIFLILSGDQLYAMDFKDMLAQHYETQADVTIAAKPLVKEKISAFGAIQVDEKSLIKKFIEKPKCAEDIQSLVLAPSLLGNILKGKAKEELCLASMGIYLFKASVLKKALDNSYTDFGKEIIPNLLSQAQLYSYIFDGYWEDIGTVRAFFEANLMLTAPIPEFNFYNAAHPIYTSSRHLPAIKLNSCKVEQSVIADGCILSGATLKKCVIGLRTCINQGSSLENVVVMGADMYETLEQIAKNQENATPNLGIGKNCTIKNAIIDMNARIGDNVVLSPEGKDDTFEYNGIYVRDGILCVSKDCVVPSNTVIARGS